jgi:4-diphosphocytidyl-2-C-methyl-D-erythritol kinase
MQNDLEIAAIALRPELRQIIADGEIAGALRSMISGSGPTVAHLAKNRIDAEQIASRLTRMGHQIITTFSTDSGARLEG